MSLLEQNIISEILTLVFIEGATNGEFKLAEKRSIYSSIKQNKIENLYYILFRVTLYYSY